MPNLITHNLSHTGSEAGVYFEQPLYTRAEDPLTGFAFENDVVGRKELSELSPLDKITKAYKQGGNFTPSTGQTFTNRILEVVDMKAQVNQNAREFEGTQHEQLLKMGVDENNLEGTPFEQIVFGSFITAVVRDNIRQSWLSSTTAEVITSGAPTGVLDENYKDYDGIWERYLAEAQDVDINSSTYLSTVGEKAVDTVTLTGTSGTANIAINGTDYLATFDTDLTTTAANFVTAHAADILARDGKLVITSSGADVVVTGGVFGLAQTVAITNVTTNLAGNVAATNAEVAPGGFKANGAYLLLRDMHNAMSNELASFDAMLSDMRQSGNDGPIPNTVPVFHITRSVYNAYQNDMEDKQGATERDIIINGRSVPAFRGIPISVHADWDTYIASDRGGQHAHRALLCVSANNVIGTWGDNQHQNLESIYDPIAQENIMRIEYKFGTQIRGKKLAVSAWS